MVVGVQRHWCDLDLTLTFIFFSLLNNAVILLLNFLVLILYL